MLTSYTIRKRKDSGKWQAIIKQKQNQQWKQVQSKTFEKKIEATQRSNQKVNEWQKKVENDYEKMTIKDLKEIYLSYKKDHVKPSTFITIKSNINSADYFDDRLINEIKPHEVIEITKTAPESHIKYMRLFFSYLIKDLEIQSKNPFKAKKPKKKSKTFVLDETDLEKIISYQTDYTTKTVITILFYTGLRISELSGLTNDSITANELIINKQYSQKLNEFTSLKSKNGQRIIPLHPKAKKAIREYQKQKKVQNINNRFIDQKYLVTSTNYNLRKSLKNTPYEGLTCHDFRHSFVSNLIQNNIDLTTVAKLAGDNVRTILQTYTHPTKKQEELSKQAISTL